MKLIDENKRDISNKILGCSIEPFFLFINPLSHPAHYIDIYRNEFKNKKLNDINNEHN